MDNKEKQYFENIIPLEEAPEEIYDLAGYQVTKAELFAHTREPSVTFWVNRLKFNMACLRRFPGVKYIRMRKHVIMKLSAVRNVPNSANYWRRTLQTSGTNR